MDFMDLYILKGTKILQNWSFQFIYFPENALVNYRSRNALLAISSETLDFRDLRGIEADGVLMYDAERPFRGSCSDEVSAHYFRKYSKGKHSLYMCF